MILLTMLAQNRPRIKKNNAVIEQFAISKSSISNRGKQPRYVSDHVANVNIERCFAMKEKKAPIKLSCTRVVFVQASNVT